jgi:hypothetical protein
MQHVEFGMEVDNKIRRVVINYSPHLKLTQLTRF